MTEERKRVQELRDEATALEARLAVKEARAECAKLVDRLFVPVWSALARAHDPSCERTEDGDCGCKVRPLEKELEQFEAEFDQRFPFGGE